MRRSSRSRGEPWGPFSSATPLPLDSISGTRLITSSGNKGNSYEVVLVTSRGEQRISDRASSDRSERTQAKAQIDHFLSDPSDKTLDVVYDEPSSGGLAMLGFSLVMSLVAWLLLTVVRGPKERAVADIEALLAKGPPVGGSP